MEKPPLVLASASPRRKRLLERAGLQYEILPSEVDETYTGEAPEQFARAIAAQKAAEVSALRPDAVVVAADTVVVLRKRVLGKPKDSNEARAMLAELSGCEHHVITGVAVRWGERERTGFRQTSVRFRTLLTEEVDRYVATGEPLDKAGAYGIQGEGARLVESLEGCYTNVVGLPMGLLKELFRDLELDHFERSTSEKPEFLEHE